LGYLPVPQTTEVYFIDNQKVKHSLSSQIFNSYFSQTKPPVKTVSIEEAAQYSLGQNIYFNKNTLIKIKGFSRVYRVTDSETGQLIWIKDEILAKKLYGHSWAKAIYEIDESVFIDYKLVDDSDNDGLSDLEEKFLGTDPQKNDTDNDSYLDGQEVFFGHNPLL